MTAWADEARLLQVVVNLLTNAVEATGPGGAVRVETGIDGDVAVLVVADTGAGIAPDLLPRVCEPFFTTKPKGTGLGLAISQALVDAHGGTLSIASGAGGTVVTLRLPRRPAE